MKTQVRFHGIRPSEPLRRFAIRQVELQLQQFQHDLSAVSVRISESNAPRGGPDKWCRITVQGPRFGSTTLDDVSDDAYAAVASCIGRMARAVGRKIARASGLIRRLSIEERVTRDERRRRRAP